MVVDRAHAVKLSWRATAALLLLVSPLTWALPGDRNQPIEIEANEALRDESRGLTVYEGDVTIRQGSILIGADEVNVSSDGRSVDRIVCKGNPATYRQQPKEGDTPVTARAQTITYDLDSDTILLTGNASLEQDDATLTGERIEYNLKQEIIRAKGESGNDRIRMVIPPSKQQEVK